MLNKEISKTDLPYNSPVLFVFQYEFINTYHLAIWKAAASLSYQVQPVPGSLHAKHCLFPGSLKKNIHSTSQNIV